MWSPKQALTIGGAAVLVVLIFGATRLLRRSAPAESAGSRAEAATPAPGASVGGAVTRREAAKAIIEARGESPAAGCTDAFFKDVPCSDPGWGWIEKLRADGLTSGCDPSVPLFCPEGLMIRAQTAMIVARSLAGGEAALPASYGPDASTERGYSCDARKPDVHFKDVGVSDIFCKHVHYLWAKGLMAATEGTSFNGAGTMTREEMTAFLAGSLGKVKR